MGGTELPVNVQGWVDALWSGETRFQSEQMAQLGEPGMDPLDWLRQRGLEDEFIRKYAFGSVMTGYFAPAISIPIFDGLARYKTVRFRRLDGQPKYDHPKGERAHLFNISSVRHPVVYLTEGEFDATILEQTGRAAVGVPGVNTFRPEWKWLFAGNDVRIVFDTEQPGSEAFKAVRQAVGRIVRALEPLAEGVGVIDLPEGEDVSSLYVRNPDELEEILRNYDS